MPPKLVILLCCESQSSTTLPPFFIVIKLSSRPRIEQDISVVQYLALDTRLIIWHEYINCYKIQNKLLKCQICFLPRTDSTHFNLQNHYTKSQNHHTICSCERSTMNIVKLQQSVHTKNGILLILLFYLIRNVILKRNSNNSGS